MTNSLPVRDQLLMSALRKRARPNIFDTRWSGSHGIGRFSTALFSRVTGFEEVELSGHPIDLMDPWRLGRYLRVLRPSLYFSPGFNVPLDSRCPFVLTVHDLNHLFVKENSSKLKRLYYSHLLRPAIQKAEFIFTPSMFSKNQIAEWSNINENRIVHIKPGVAQEFCSIGDRYTSDQPYFLFVGTHAPHKNLCGAIKAFSISGLKGQFEFLATGLPSNEIARLIDELELDGHVRFLGRVSDSMLPKLYRGATALVFVSLYEGFGLPIIESMSCGTPVLTSNVASMPEAAGGAAILVNPKDSEEISDAMRTIANDDSLREQLRLKGLEWSKQFNWDKTCTVVMDALARLM